MEAKTFDELTLDDTIYSRNGDGDVFVLQFKSIKKHESSRTKIIIVDLDDEEHELPIGESAYMVDDDIMYTTSHNTYKKWRRPYVERQIEAQKKKIQECEAEILQLESELYYGQEDKEIITKNKLP